MQLQTKQNTVKNLKDLLLLKELKTSATSPSKQSSFVVPTSTESDGLYVVSLVFSHLRQFWFLTGPFGKFFYHLKSNDALSTSLKTLLIGDYFSLSSRYLKVWDI